MIDFKSFQKEVYEITKFLGYKVSKKNTLKKLREEYKEFKQAKPVNSYIIDEIANTKDDNLFKSMFNLILKDTEADEIPDDIFIKASYCEHMGYDLETLLMIKKRYNSLRIKE